VTLSAGGLIAAGAVLSQNPWRSVDGYVGHAWGVQLLALVSVGMLAASTVEVLASAGCRN
jgi:arabinofuranan 3-O-arabinosyltransferase